MARSNQALKPDLVEAYHNLGVSLSEKGRLDEADRCIAPRDPYRTAPCKKRPTQPWLRVDR